MPFGQRPVQMTRREVLAALVVASVPWIAGVRPVTAAEGELSKGTLLLMIEDRGCPYCTKFDAETRAGYVNSAEGKLAPLVRRRRGDPEIAFIQRVVYSPTFVLLVNGREVGRTVGYQGSELFWMEIANLMRMAGLRGAGG